MKSINRLKRRYSKTWATFRLGTLYHGTWMMLHNEAYEPNRETLQSNLELIVDILKERSSKENVGVLKDMKRHMWIAARLQDYERAAQLRDMIDDYYKQIM